MEKNKKMIVGVISALLILVILIPFGMKMAEKKEGISNSNPTKNREIEIKDTCEEGLAFPQAIEEYYEDEKYVCSFNVIKSGCYIVKVDGKEYPLKDALNNKIITVEEAIKHGMYCTKKELDIEDNPESNSNTNSNIQSNSNTNKPSNSNSNVVSNKNTNTNSSTNIVSNSNITGTKKISVVDKCGDYLTQQIDEFYQDNQYIYYFTAGRSGCIYVQVNNQEYTLKNALNEKIVTIEELESVGLKCLKRSKNLVEK